MMNVQHETRNQVWASLLSGDPELFPELATAMRQILSDVNKQAETIEKGRQGGMPKEPNSECPMTASTLSITCRCLCPACERGCSCCRAPNAREHYGASCWSQYQSMKYIPCSEAPNCLTLILNPHPDTGSLKRVSQ